VVILEELDEYIEYWTELMYVIYQAVKDVPEHLVKPSIRVLFRQIFKQIVDALGKDAVEDVLRGVEVAKMRIQLKKLQPKVEYWKKYHLEERMKRET